MNLADLADTLHRELAEELLARLRSGEATSADLNQIRQFLRDNNVTDLALGRKPVRDLATEVEFNDPHEPVILRPLRDEA